MDRLANLLHAMSTAVADRQMTAMKTGSGLSSSAVAVVLTLGQHELQSASDLATVTGLSHSATVRLIDRLENDGIVRRSEERQGRNVPVALTDRGQTEYQSIRKCQSEFLTSLLSELSPVEKQSLEHLLTHLLSRLSGPEDVRDYICRFCDEGVCEQASCPVETAHQQTAARK